MSRLSTSAHTRAVRAQGFIAADRVDAFEFSFVGKYFGLRHSARKRKTYDTFRPLFFNNLFANP